MEARRTDNGQSEAARRGSTKMFVDIVGTIKHVVMVLNESPN